MESTKHAWACGTWVGRSLLSLVMLASAAGCTVFVPRDSPLPKDGPTMEEIYRKHSVGSSASGSSESDSRSPRDRLAPRSLIEDDEVVEQRRRLSEPLNNRFERLPNPDMVMHVFPHLAQGKYPVPGYETVFPMYESVAYALPGEVAPRHQRSGSFTAATGSEKQGKPQTNANRGSAANAPSTQEGN